MRKRKKRGSRSWGRRVVEERRVVRAGVLLKRGDQAYRPFTKVKSSSFPRPLRSTSPPGSPICLWAWALAPPRKPCKRAPLSILYLRIHPVRVALC